MTSKNSLRPLAAAQRDSTGRLRIRIRAKAGSSMFWRTLYGFLCLQVLLSVSAIHARPLVEEYRQAPDRWPPFQVDEGVEAVELGSPSKPSKQAWQTRETERLGRMLFFDPRLSSSGQLACVSCHDSQLGWGDGKRFSAGHDRQEGTRNAMSLLNVAYKKQLFWDGRADGILDLILRPIESPLEMNADLPTVINRLNSIDGYRERFQEAFGDDQATPERITKGIAAFLLTIFSSKSRFDHFVGGDFEALSDQEIRGLHLFRTKARCMNCHHGPLLTDNQFHHTGLSYYGRRFEDLGRFQATNEVEDRGKFRTPSLRDLPFTRPWMHNGLFTDLTGILRMYNHGISFNSSVRHRPGTPPLSPLIKPLDLSKEEIADLEAFLVSVSRTPRHVFAPTLPPITAEVTTTSERTVNPTSFVEESEE
ncbi:MAG: cytochrome-c peroxidase [Gammaproteobacteria bacterium]|nr:cytochrome-c peroxidase [Gammaproteobacteria bacterium]